MPKTRGDALEGKFGAGYGEVLSLIPGGPSFCPLVGLLEPQGFEKERRESAEGVVARATFAREGPNQKTTRKRTGQLA